MTRPITVAIAALALTLGLQAPAAHAAVVTHGFLSSDDTTNFITDSAHNRQYTRLDAFDLTVAQVETAIGAGGAFEGWSVMTSAIADGFIASILGLASTACDGAVGYGTYCGTVTGWAADQFGRSYTSSYDYIAFYNTNGGNPIGLLQLTSSGRLDEYENWSDASTLDVYANTAPINLMLYRDIAAVPVPASGLFAMAGLGGLAALRRRKARLA